jgi:hypothetical protein
VAEVRLEQRIKTFNCEVPNLHLITNLHWALVDGSIDL